MKYDLTVIHLEMYRISCIAKSVLRVFKLFHNFLCKFETAHADIKGLPSKAIKKK